MTKLIFGIFAHPDDAAFGPGGSLALAARDGAEVHLICATCGGAGVNTSGHEDLSAMREAEERRSADILGVRTCALLRYDDGKLCNEIYLEVAEKVITHIRSLVTDPSCTITLITFDPNGISGHTDHIVMSNVTTYIYLKLRGEFTMQLKYFCIPDSLNPSANTGWLYMPKGRTGSEIDEITDVRAVKEQKIAAINAHQTQANDAKFHLARGDSLFDEHFFYFKD